MALAQAKMTDDVRRLRIPHGLIVHTRAVEAFDPRWFDPASWRSEGTCEALDAGRGAAWLVEGQHGAWVLRHYRRGGAVARVLHDRYFWLGRSRSRSLAEFMLLGAMRAAGLPVPVPVAARVQRYGITYTADLITEYVAGTRSLGERLQAGAADDEILAQVGRCIARFHAAGIWHADLNAHNVLLDEQGKVTLIDFDRARLRAGKRWQSANLARLRRSLDKLARAGGEPGFDISKWRIVESAYGDARA